LPLALNNKNLSLKTNVYGSLVPYIFCSEYRKRRPRRTPLWVKEDLKGPGEKFSSKRGLEHTQNPIPNGTDSETTPLRETKRRR
jgi:hypothetical protein